MSYLRLEDNSKRFPILVPLMKEKGTFEFSSYWCKIDLDPIQIHRHISWLSYCNVVIFGFVAHAWVKKEYRLRAALSSWKTSPMDYGQIIWRPVGARMFVLEKRDRRAEQPLISTPILVIVGHHLGMWCNDWNGSSLLRRTMPCCVFYI